MTIRCVSWLAPSQTVLKALVTWANQFLKKFAEIHEGGSNTIVTFLPYIC